jgi:hypothetical protein
VKKEKAKVGDIVVVEWVDADSESTELSEEDFQGLVKVKTYGVLLEKNDQLIRLGTEVLTRQNGKVTYRASTTIPRCWVKVRKL